MTTTPSSRAADATTHLVLVPGFWLGAWAWDEVLPGLIAAGLAVHPVTLPGLRSAEEDRSSITRADHVAAVCGVVAELGGPVVLVGHSGGAPLVHEVVDADPSRISRAVYVDAGPLVDGAAVAPDLPPDVVELPLPSWEEFAAEGNSADGLDETARERFRARAVPHPAAVARSRVRLRDERRKSVPVTVVCSSIPSALLQEMATTEAPFFTELPELDAEYVDLPTGHWPMFSRPGELAELLAAVALRTRPAEA